MQPHLADQVFDGVFARQALHIALQSPQRRAHHAAMMQLAATSLVKPQPQLV